MNVAQNVTRIRLRFLLESFALLHRFERKTHQSNENRIGMHKNLSRTNDFIANLLKFIRF